ncbi:ABC transporter ATP-binding protein [Candidatus Bathyarchaeota archaeon]|nr:MAG: ABC transporter ATP-binding protein [Candidatus Bathyarchaeota archaeon]
MNMPILDVQNLSTYYLTDRGPVRAAEGVSFQLEKGEAMGLAGESGCGKTTVALSLLRILPQNGRIVDGRILIKDIDVVRLNENEMRKKIRWKTISMIFQGAMNALNPLYKVGDQIAEAILIHEPDVTRREAKERTAKLLEMVGIEPSRVDNFPHEFSGGMKQRALIAMSLACNPNVVIADEPGTALDVIVQAQVLRLMRNLQDKLNLSVIMIAHDLSMIAEICQKIAIMYAGYLVEYGDIVKIFKKPLHPYTQDLIESFPSIKSEKQEMVSIPGFPPDLLHPPPGCRFHPRCKYAMDVCKKKVPKLREITKNHLTACHLVKG